jgi:hypothetical protein
MTEFDYYFLYLGIILVPVIISGFIMEKAQAKLSAEIKLELINAFSGKRKYSMLMLAGLILLMCLLVRFIPDHSLFISVGFLLTISALLIIRNIKNTKKLKALAVPEEYIKKFRVSALITASGFIIFIIVLLCVSSFEDYGNDAAEQAYKGYTFMREKKYKEAVSEFTKAIAGDSSQASYFTNRGTSYYYLHDTVSACFDWKKAQLLGDQAAVQYMNSFCK